MQTTRTLPTPTPTLQTTLKRVARGARRADLPPDTLKRFIAAGYLPFPKQLLFHAAAREADLQDGPTEIGFGGARGPGKTHAAFAQIAIDDAQRAAGLKILFLRKVEKYGRESIDDLRRKVLKNVSHRIANSIIYFPNDSRIICGGFRNEKDIDNYLSLEYDVILIEQAEQLTEKKLTAIATVNRNARDDFRPRIYFTFNPGGVSHNYLKRRFIIPERLQEEEETRFIGATYRDNPALNKEYKAVLNRLKGWQKRAWRDGDWEILAGTFFQNFREDVHVFDFESDFAWVKDKEGNKRIPEDATVWGSFDYGFTHYTVFYLLAKVGETTYVLGENAYRKQLPPFHADRIRELLGRFHLTTDDLVKIVAGPDTFANRGDKEGRTVADQYAEEEIFLSRANPDRISGASAVLNGLGDVDQGQEPTLLISRECVKLIETLPVLEHDPKRPADVKKVDTDDDGEGGDDAYDSVRYGVIETPGSGAWL